MDDGAADGGYRDDCSCVAEMLKEIMDHEMGAFDVGFLQMLRLSGGMK